MLVLSRKAGERIHIGKQITVEVRRISGNRVTIALKAPRDIRILRGELEKAATDFDSPQPLLDSTTQQSPLPQEEPLVVTLNAVKGVPALANRQLACGHTL